MQSAAVPVDSSLQTSTKPRIFWLCCRRTGRCRSLTKLVTFSHSCLFCGWAGNVSKVRLNKAVYCLRAVARSPSTACHSKQPIHAVPEIILRTMPLKAPRNFPSAHLDICSNLPEKDAHFELSCQSFCCVCYMVARHVEPREFLFSRARACECMCVCVCVCCLSALLCIYSTISLPTKP